MNLNNKHLKDIIEQLLKEQEYNDLWKENNGK